MFRPKIKEYFDIFPSDGDSYQVRGPEHLSVLRGNTIKQVFGHLLPLLDGEHTTDQLADKLNGVAPPATVQAIVQRLADMGVLEDVSTNGHSELSPEQAQVYHRQMMFFNIVKQTADGPKYQKALLDSRVSLIGDSDLASRIAAECATAGVGTVVGWNLAGERLTDKAAGRGRIEARGLDAGDLDALERKIADDAPALLVLALDRPQPVLLNRVNQMSQDLKIPLLHSRVSFKEGIVGPLVVPGKTACLKCHHLRVTRNYNFYEEHVQWEKWLSQPGNQNRAAGAALAPLAGIVAGLAALEVVKALSSFYESALYGKFLTVNSLTLEVIPHQILRVPRCPSCGKLRGKVSLNPWIKDERDSAQGRVSYKRPGNAGENGADH
jgi:bacteriocin biosynthesis cyclodehydratase domain-containing protein